MPKFLVLDILGKLLLLISVGWQVLVLTPALERRAGASSSAQYHLLLALVDDQNRVLSPGNSPPAEALSFRRKRIQDAIDIVNYENDQVVRERERQSFHQLIVLMLFAIGSLFSLFGLYLEKRDRN